MDSTTITQLLTENGPGVILAVVFGYLFFQERKARVASDLALKEKMEQDVVLYREIALKAVPSGV